MMKVLLDMRRMGSRGVEIIHAEASLPLVLSSRDLAEREWTGSCMCCLNLCDSMLRLK